MEQVYGRTLMYLYNNNNNNNSNNNTPIQDTFLLKCSVQKYPFLSTFINSTSQAHNLDWVCSVQLHILFT